MSRADAVSEARENGTRPDERVIAEAAYWLVRLDDGGLGASGREALEAWRARSPEHERAWRAALALKDLVGSVPGDIGGPVLGRRRLDRRAVLKSLAGLMAAAPAGWVAYRQLPWREWTADYRTATGEVREVALADGTRVVLNTATDLDVAFSEASRLLVLHRGEVLVTTAADAGGRSRPFVVQTTHGRVRALGTRFGVREARGWTEVSVLEDAVALSPREGGAPRVLPAGRRARLTAHGVERAGPIKQTATAWTRGQIVAHDSRLGDLAAELDRYRPGRLRCDPAVAQLRISGVFQVDDTDRALRIIAETLPVRLSSVTGYWVSIGPKP